MTNPRVLFIIDSLKFGGGAERVLSLIISQLRKKFNIFTLTFVDADKKYNTKGRYHSLEENKKKISILRRYVGLNAILRPFKIYQHIKIINPDIIISFTDPPNIFTIISKIIFKIRIPLIITVHSNPLMNYQGVYGYINNMITLIYPNPSVNKIVIVSKDISKILQTHHQINRNKIKVIHNPIDLDFIKRLRGEDISDPRWSDSEDFRLINVSSFRKEKNHILLLKAFSRVKKQKPSIKLILIGDGTQRKAIQILKRKLNLEQEVILLGLKRNPYKYIENADIFVLSSIYEGFPVVLLEALACEVPIISTNCLTGPREILDHGKYGILTLNNDVEDLAKKILYLANHKDLREKYTSLSKKRAKDFDISVIIKNWIRLIEGIIG